MEGLSAGQDRGLRAEGSIACRGADLTTLKGFAEMVNDKLNILMTKGAAAAIAGLTHP